MASEDGKRRSVKTVAWASWLTALFGTMWVTFGFGVGESDFRRQFGVVVVMFIGVAIASGLSLSRQKLSDTIVAALKTGYDLSEEKARKRMNAAEIMASQRHEEAMIEARNEAEKQKAERLRVQIRNDKEDNE